MDGAPLARCDPSKRRPESVERYSFQLHSHTLLHQPMTQPRSPYKEQQRERHPFRDAMVLCVTHRNSRLALVSTILLFLALSSSREYRGSGSVPVPGNDTEGFVVPTEIRTVQQTVLPAVPNGNRREGTAKPDKSPSEVKADKSTLTKDFVGVPTEAPTDGMPSVTTNFESTDPPNEASSSTQTPVEQTKPPEQQPSELPVPTGYESYSSKNYPILDSKMLAPDKDNPVQVQVFMGSQSSYMRYLVGGVERSIYTELKSVSLLQTWDDVSVIPTNTLQPDKPTVWLVDFESLDRDCHKVERLIEDEHKANEYKSDIFLVILDMSGSSEVVDCPRVEQWIPRDRTRLARRGIVENRYWDEDAKWINVGDIVPNKGVQVSGGPVVHVPFLVRESMVNVVALVSGTQNVRSKKKSPVSRERSIDVAHFWNEGDYAHYSFLRRRVSAVVGSLEETKTGGRKIHTLVEHRGDDVFQNETQPEYIEGLMAAKIVVVAQRDEWEDHYRLFDSIVSGAMVMTDTMHGLPEGFEHKKNIVVYDSAEALETHLREYLNPKNDKTRLEIAQSGWELAMGRHRSWHRVERLLFGEPKSHVDKFYEEAPARRIRQSGKTNRQ